MTITQTRATYTVRSAECLVEAGTGVRVGTLAEAGDRQAAIKIIRNGGVVAIQVRGVVGIFGDGSHNEAVAKAHRIKGSSRTKPLSMMLPSDEVLPVVDMTRVAEPLKPLLEDPKKFQELVGGMSHSRFPVVGELAQRLPSMTSCSQGRAFMHNLDPTGLAIEPLIKELLKEGGLPLFTTTLNTTGEKEITDLREATEFCQGSQEINLVLADPRPKRHGINGSFTIVDFATQSVIRDGHIPHDVVRVILGGVVLKTDQMVNHKYPLSPEIKRDFDRILELHLPPPQLRYAIFAYIEGKSVEQIARAAGVEEHPYRF